ncbi:translation initiation factor IF-1 [Patescibacteria group bacterium]|nr:translation initiation factor IF-1 [Patescibacteria group bacterium]MCG2702432.1 translation initiation factor IF-1 [Candidatus Parcubacteria bacterium]MBU4210328.1 translation initiation factor IF-1 [Patescibacteria group bacterium]MBU4264518.1 translation initiation factor IF-1 [Patescibacteria group bacterium]MBU4390449.1 translation initiation factor IF-1 [Patescibacteria group bacterium]
MTKTKEPPVTGVVTECLPSTLFRVKLEDGKEIIGHLAGKLRVHRIRIMAGDKVSLIISSDGDKGRIVYRN